MAPVPADELEKARKLLRSASSTQSTAESVRSRHLAFLTLNSLPLHTRIDRYPLPSTWDALRSLMIYVAPRILRAAHLDMWIPVLRLQGLLRDVGR